jgi:vitamin B12 transporter
VRHYDHETLSTYLFTGVGQFLDIHGDCGNRYRAGAAGCNRKPNRYSGATMTVVTREQLEQRQVPFVADILREVPGLAVNRSGGVGALTQIRLRGAEASQTLVLIDGVEANDPASGSAFDFAHLLTADVERIEIVRGPQSALWGSDALAGVINIITRRGRGPLEFSGSIEGGSFGTVYTQARLAGGNEYYDFSLGSAYLDTAGTNIAREGDEDDGYKNITGFLKGGIKLLENLSLNVIARHTDATTESDPTPPPLFLPVDGDEESDVEQNYARAQIRLDLFNGLWQHVFGIAITDTDNEFFPEVETKSSAAGQKLRLDYQTTVFVDTPAIANATHALTFALDREDRIGFLSRAVSATTIMMCSRMPPPTERRALMCFPVGERGSTGAMERGSRIPCFSIDLGSFQIGLKAIRT